MEIEADRKARAEQLALEARQRIEAEAKAFYDSLTDEQIAEESDWGRVGYTSMVDSSDDGRIATLRHIK